MQSYRNRRTKPESKCNERTSQIQAGQEPTVQTLGLVTVPAKLQQIGFTLEEPEEFLLLIETGPVVFAYMPSIE